MALALHRHGQLTRTQLVQRLGVSAGSVSVATRTLIDDGIVEETGELTSGVGRPAIPLRLRPSGWTVLAFELVAGSLRFAIIDAAGTIVYRREQRLSARYSPAEAVRHMVEAAAESRIDKQASIEKKVPLGAAVSVSGVVLDGNVLLSTGLGWRDVPLAHDLEAALGLPVRLVNDMDARALAEYRYGAGMDYSHVLFVSIEPVGIGAGIVHGGQLYKGARGGAAELGHLVVERHGLACPCGRRGCLDVYSSENAIVARAQHLSRFRPTATEEIPEIGELRSEIERLWREAASNPGMRRIFEDAMDYFGIAVSNLVTVLDPDVVLVGGHLPRTVGRWGIETLTAHVRRSAAQHVPGQPPILSAVSGDDAGLRGAAYALTDYWLGEAVPSAASSVPFNSFRQKGGGT